MKAVKISSLRFEELSFRYEASESLVFEEVSFDFPMGRFVKIESVGGTGKSTVLRLMAALLDPVAGRYFVNEQDVTDMSFEEFMPLRLEIGYSFDLGGLLNNRTLSENIALPLMYHKICSASEIGERVDEMLEVFELHKVAHQRPSAVRGSDRKSTVLARALIMQPQVLLLDEPTTGLSAGVTERFVSEIKRQQQHKLSHIFVSTDDQKLLSEFDVFKIQIQNKKLHVPAFIDVGRSSSEAA